MPNMRVATCGDCIHADVCERNPLYTEFSRDNPAYCEGFKDKKKLVEVVHGRWIPADYKPYVYCKCSECGRRITCGEESDYCPRCGAKMDGGKDNG